MESKLKTIIKKLSKLGLDLHPSFDSGISLFGMNISKAKKAYGKFRGIEALEQCIKLPIKTVADIGSGGGEHANLFHKTGLNVTCIDYGTSVYAEKAKLENGIDIIYTDFLNWKTSEKYDLVWASHILEHQRNVGVFIEKLISICNPNGYICITVPFPHRNIWGGHLTLWQPGLLAYNVVMCGIDLSSAKILYGYREISIIFQLKKFQFPNNITFDNGDVRKLEQYFPIGFKEDKDSWF
jgi:SAM-dependent methyltransferase